MRMNPIAARGLVLLSLFGAAAGAAAAEPIRVACVGNSITHGGGGTTSYPGQLGPLLGAGYDVRNFGVGGTTLLKKGDFPYWNETAFRNALDFRPHIVILSLGTNDSKPQNRVFLDEFFADCMDMIGRFRAVNPNVHLLVCNCPPVIRDGYGITDSVIRDRIIPILRAVRDSAVTDSIDWYGKLLDKGELFPDGIHPNGTGYGLMAGIARDAILNSPSGIIRTFEAEPDSFETGETMLLRWMTTAGSGATLNGEAVADADSTVLRPTGPVRCVLRTSGAFSDSAVLTPAFLAPGRIRSFTAEPSFLDEGGGDSTRLAWRTSAGTNAFLDGVPVEPTGAAAASPAETRNYTLTASGSERDTAVVTVSVLPAERINRAFRRPVAEYPQSPANRARFAVDGDTSTVWESGPSSPEWIQVDLGRVYAVRRVALFWGRTHGVMYHLQVPDERGLMRLRIHSETAGDGGTDDITGLEASTRLLRLNVVSKSDPDSLLELREIEVYGAKAASAVGRPDAADPVRSGLLPNFPNPFNPVTEVRWNLAERGRAAVFVFDARGRRTAVLADGVFAAGPHRAAFDASGLPSGIYVCRLRAGAVRESRKMLLIR
jgi:acyl-CoA thioesterase I